MNKIADKILEFAKNNAAKDKVQLSEEIAQLVVEEGAKHAFSLFQDKEFQKFFRFDKKEQIEKDRIFNELVLANIINAIFILESPDLRIPEKLKFFYEKLKEDIPKKHLSSLQTLGIKKKYLDFWTKLIKMRFEEYENHKNQVRLALMDNEKNLDTEKMKSLTLLSPLKTVCICSLLHIMRGEEVRNEKLFLFYESKLANFYFPLRLAFEGISVGFLTKLKIKVRRLLGKIIKI